MKTLFFVLATTVISTSVFAQQSSMSVDGMNVFYESVSNPITVIVENCNCKHLIVETDNGTVTQSAPCKYSIGALKVGNANITIKQKIGQRIVIVGHKSFRVKEIPKPRARCGGESGGEISIQVFKVQLGLAAYLDGFDFEARFRVSKYTMTIIRNKQILSQVENVGPVFTADAKNVIAEVKIGDKVIFEKIYCKTPDAKVVQLASLKFTIIP